MKFLPVVTLCVFIALCLFATPQIPDTIILNGREYDLIVLSGPLCDYFAEHPDKHPDELQRKSRFFRCTALHRGYIATYEIRDKQLFVKDVRVMDYGKNFADDNPFEDAWLSVFKEIFPDDDAPKADWFAGTLIIPKSKFLYYAGYACFLERYLLIDIKNGNVVKKRTISHLGLLARLMIKGYCEEHMDELRWKNLPHSSKCLLFTAVFGATLLVVLRLRRARKRK